MLAAPWWSAPLLIAALGVPFALWRASRYPGGDYDLRPLVFIFWFAIFAFTAIGMAGAHYLGL